MKRIERNLFLVSLGDDVMSIVCAGMSLYDLLSLMSTCKQLIVSVTPLLRNKLWYVLNSINVEPLLAGFDTLIWKMSTEFPLMTMSPQYFQCRFLHLYILLINARLINSKVNVIAQRPHWKLQVHVVYNCCETLRVLSLLTQEQMRQIDLVL